MGNKVKRQVLMVSFVALVAVVLAGAGSAWAVTPSYAPDYRGAPNSVHAIFDWYSNEQVEWTTTLFESVSDGYPLDQTPPSASDDGLDMTVMLPNFIDPLPMKKMRVQLFFDGAVDSTLIEGSIFAYDPTGEARVEDAGGSGDVTDSFLYYDFEIFPNPDWEQITLYGNSNANIVPGNLLRVEIDTISMIPEPVTLGLLVIGGLALLSRRR